MTKRSIIGILLILIGVFVFLSQAGYIGGEIILYGLGIGFILIYIAGGATAEYGNVGWIIPGSIILAIALFSSVEDLVSAWFPDGGIFFWFLSAAFFAIYAVHTRKAGKDWGDRNWPLFPAIGLAAFGSLIGFLSSLKDPENLQGINYITALAMIITGLYLIVSQMKNKTK